MPLLDTTSARCFMPSLSTTISLRCSGNLDCQSECQALISDQLSQSLIDLCAQCGFSFPPHLATVTCLQHGQIPRSPVLIGGILLPWPSKASSMMIWYISTIISDNILIVTLQSKCSEQGLEKICKSLKFPAGNDLSDSTILSVAIPG